jgi:calcineurin-like phosphoesterase family protein
MIYFTSDTHFFHENIIRFCARPFANAEHMNDELIERWNNVVGKNDEVFHLGDVTFGPTDLTAGVLGQLNGKKYLVPGNHDRPRVLAPMFDKLLPQYFELNHNRKKFVLCHFPIEQWRGNYHLHGHSHGTCRKAGRRRDVGVDCYGFSPVSIDALVEEMHNDQTDIENREE